MQPTERFEVFRPSDVAALFARLRECPSNTSADVIIHLYHLLLDQEAPDWRDMEYGKRILQPHYDAWCAALSACEKISTKGYLAGIHFRLDLTRPSLPGPGVHHFWQYEARGLLRITALLRSKFMAMAPLQASLEGLHNQYVLKEAEKHVALPLLPGLLQPMETPGATF